MARITLQYIYNVAAAQRKLVGVRGAENRLVPSNRTALAEICRSITGKNCTASGASAVWSFLGDVISALPRSPGSVMERSAPTPVIVSENDLEKAQRARLVEFIVACCSEKVYGLKGRFAPANAHEVLTNEEMISTRSLVAACCSLYNCFTDIALAHMSRDSSDCYLVDLCTAAMQAAVDACPEAAASSIAVPRANLACLSLVEDPTADVVRARATSGLAAASCRQSCVDGVRSRIARAAADAMSGIGSARPSSSFSLPFSYDYIDSDIPNDPTIGMLGDTALPMLIISAETKNYTTRRPDQPAFCAFLHPFSVEAMRALLLAASETHKAFIVEGAVSDRLVALEINPERRVRCTAFKRDGKSGSQEIFLLTEAGAAHALHRHMCAVLHATSGSLYFHAI